MSLLVINICRVCRTRLKTEQQQCLLNTNLLEKFIFTTQLKLKINSSDDDVMPTSLCSKCVMRLKLAYDFVWQARESDKSLRQFMQKIAADFLQVAQESAEVEDDDIMNLLMQEEQQAATSASSTQRSSTNKEVNNKTAAVEEQPQKTQKPFMLKSQERESPEAESENHMISTVIDCQEQRLNVDANDVAEQIDYNEQLKLSNTQTIAADTSEMELISLPASVTTDDETQEVLLLDEDISSGSVHRTQESGYLKEYEAMLQESHAQNANELEEITMEEHHLLEDGEETDDTIVLQVDESAEDGEEDENEELDTVEMISVYDNTETEMVNDVVRQAHKNTQARAVKIKKSALNAPLHERFICDTCDKDFSSKTNLKRHMSQHLGNKPYMCTYCGKCFSQNGSVRQHILTHTGEKPYKCDVCERGFTQRKSLVLHRRRHTGDKPFSCVHCGLFFRQKDALRSHIMKHHIVHQQEDDTHVCNICREVLPTPNELRIHTNMHMNNQEPFAVNTNEQHINASSLEELHVIKEENQTNEQQEEVDDDDYSLNMKEIKSETNIVHFNATSASEPKLAKRYQCRKCFKCFSIKNSLIRHLSTHGISVSYKQITQCKICENYFGSESELIAHMQQHEDISMQLNECAECHSIFDSLKALEYHLASAHNFVCSVCKTCFQSREQLTAHMLQEHHIKNTDLIFVNKTFKTD